MDPSLVLERKLFSDTTATPVLTLGLPKGWVREELVRSTGLSAGKVDVCYLSPDGKKFWTKPQLARYFGDTVDLSNFDFQTGKFNSNHLQRNNKRDRRSKISSSEYCRGMKSDTSLIPPIRQTASIFKQPVTLVKTQNSRVKSDFKHGIQESPKQLFWEKRLEGLTASDSSGARLVPVNLPQGITAVGPRITADTVLHSVATALHVTTQPIVGQTANRSILDSNPGVYVNPEQPLIHEVVVNEEDIRVQEDHVLNARKKLQEALSSFFPIPAPPKVEEPPVRQNQNGTTPNSNLKGKTPQKKLRTGAGPVYLIKNK